MKNFEMEEEVFPTNLVEVTRFTGVEVKEAINNLKILQAETIKEFCLNDVRAKDMLSGFFPKIKGTKKLVAIASFFRHYLIRKAKEENLCMAQLHKFVTNADTISLVEDKDTKELSFRVVNADSRSLISI